MYALIEKVMLLGNRRMDGRKCHDKSRNANHAVHAYRPEHTNERQFLEHQRTPFMTRMYRRRIVEASRTLTQPETSASLVRK